jgi:hypothetical protein
MLLSLSLLLGILLISNWMGTGSASRSISQEILRSLSAFLFLAVSAALLVLISSTNISYGNTWQDTNIDVGGYRISFDVCHPVHIEPIAR